MIETKTGETSFATGIQENKKNERFWKRTRTKNKNTGLGHWKTWHINKQTTELQPGDPKKNRTPSTKSWALQENKWTIALWVGPLINELIHALDYLVNAINENENQLIPREKTLSR